MIRLKLKARGIDPETAASAAATRPEDEEARARALAIKRAGSLRGQPPEVRYRRIVGVLARRGYPSDVVARVAAEVARLPEDGNP